MARRRRVAAAYLSRSENICIVNKRAGGSVDAISSMAAASRSGEIKAANGA